MAQKTNELLKDLPIWIVKVNSKWYRNMKTMAFIKKEHLANHLPKQQTEVKEYWWNKL